MTLIYLDNAATSLWKPPAVAQAVVEALGQLGNAARGAHASSLDAGRVVYMARRELATLFRVGGWDAAATAASRVAFTKNVTEALNVALQGLLRPGDHVITTAMDHNSVLRPVHALGQRGMDYSIVPIDGLGRLDLDALSRSFRPSTRAVVTAHASNVTGNVNPLGEIAVHCREHGALLVVDAAQSAGTLDIDVATLGIDVLCFTGHKGLLGPQGTGGLAVHPDVEISPLLFGGTGIHSFDQLQPVAMPERLEAGTLNIHGLAGLLAAVEYLNGIGITAIGDHERAMADSFFQQVEALPGVRCYGDQAAAQRVGIISLNVGAQDAALVSDRLMQEFGIATRAGIHCAPLLHTAMGTASRGMVRFSFGHSNTFDDVDTAVRAVTVIATS